MSEGKPDVVTLDTLLDAVRCKDHPQERAALYASDSIPIWRCVVCDKLLVRKRGDVTK